MRRLLFALTMILALALLAPATARADDDDDKKGDKETASVFIVHGIPGADVSPALPPSLPVDISVNGACAVTDFTFGTILGPLSLAEGAYEIKIFVADPAADCAGSPVITSSVKLEDESYSIVAHLTEAGGLTASLFENDLDDANKRRAYVAVHHTAKAPAVDVTLARNGNKALVIKNLVNGEQEDGKVRSGSYNIAIAPAGSKTPVFTAGPVALAPNKAYLVFAVGSLDKGTFTLLTKAIDNVDQDDD
jgi:hypothetical protein